jgi:predicted O-linked N-acetylglucosamine transferase (SPINDLY family)
MNFAGKVLPDLSVIQEAEEALSQNRPDQAIRFLESYCNQHPGNAQGWFLLGIACHQARKTDAALQSLERAISIEPRHVQARSAKGAVLYELGRHQEALQVYRKALHLAPADAQLLVNLGVVQEHLNDVPGALERYGQALASLPDFTVALLNRGALLIRLGRLEEALADNRRLVELHPDWDSAQHNLGEALLALGRWDDALAAYERALRLSPDSARTLFARGLALAMLCHFDEAQQDFDHSRSIDSRVFESCIRAAAAQTGSEVREFPPKVIYLLKEAQRQENCDWTGRERFVENFDNLIRSSLGRPDEICERALLFRSLSLPISPEMRLALANSVSTHIANSVGAKHPTPFIHQHRNNRRLKIGYVSPNFRAHPNAIVTRSLYGLHDRSRFEVYGYSLHPGDNSELRRDIERGCDHFRELSGCSDIAAAESIHADGIDVLIDLAGYTTFSRTEILALRPAPIQVAFHGFPHSMGASFIHYYIADSVAVPAGAESLFTECLAYMPDSYYMFNNRQVPSACRFTRAELGLPEQGFVFCCFNNHYKIEPEVFDIWMRLLKRVPGSVLWLYYSGDAVAANLRHAAEERGVSAQRLIFAPHMDNDAHLARYRLADLFLDTFLYNAHTTAIEALWAGLPVLTCPGRAMPSRVAASLLTAVGLQELITSSPQQYEELAYALATQENRLAQIRSRLAANRPAAPLFDTERQVRNLEAAYRVMWQRHQAGLPPASFHVPAVTEGDLS